MMRTILNSKLFFVLVLATPAVPVLAGLAAGTFDAMDAIHPSGEWSVRLMILAMIIGPLADIAGAHAWLRWLLARRRWLGLAAFLYAVAHLAFYLIDMGALDDILAEFAETGIWTGWAAFLLIAVPAATSNDRAMRALSRNWKRLQRLAYPAAVLIVLHWGLLTWEWGPSAAHFGPLLLVNLVRLTRRRTPHRAKELPA